VTGFPRQPRYTDGPRPDWDVSVLDVPAVLAVPDPLSTSDDPLIQAAIDALLAVAADRPAGYRPIGDLARAGVVAIHTSHGCFEVQETLLGWTLVPAEATPDIRDLAEAARLRAYRLARERRGPGSWGQGLPGRPAREP
jgi:hypothetical protein